MKRLLGLLLAFIIMLLMCACKGNFGSINLNDPISIPESGEIEENIIAQIQKENAIGVFTGQSGDFYYEWTIFGSDVQKAAEINLAVSLSVDTDGNVQVALANQENFGFSALLSIYLNDTWNVQSATAYIEDTAFASVSVTTSKNTILNLTLDGANTNFEIRPDPLSED